MTARDRKGRFVASSGVYLDTRGYWCYSAGINRGRRVHRVLCEQRLGRSLKRDEVVHHIDGNKQNNDMANLLVMSERDHNAVSAKQAWYFRNVLWPEEKAQWDAFFSSSAIQS